MDADRTALPVAGCLDPALVEPAVVDEVATHELRGLRFARSPGVSFAAIRQRQRADSIEQRRGVFGARPRAAHPDCFDLSAAFELLLLLGAGDSSDDNSLCVRTQLFQTPAYRGQSRLVANEKVPVEIIRHDERSA